MKLDFKLLKRILLILAVLSPLAFGLRLYTYWNELEATTSFFSGNGAGCFVYNCIGFAVFFLCLLLTLRRTGSFVGGSAPIPTLPEETEEEDSLLMQDAGVYDAEQDFPQYFLHGFAKKCAIWFGTFSAFAALFPGFALISHGLSFVVNKETDDPFKLIYLILSLLSGVFFLVYSFRNSSERSRFIAFFALVPTFWSTFRMIIEYRDLTHYLNKSLYIGQFLFVISTLVFFLYQAEILLGEDKISRPNAYVFSGLSVVFFGLTARIPHVIAIMGERIATDLFTSTCLLADLAITLFVASKLMVTTKRK